MDSEELLDVLFDNFIYEVPKEIVTADELKEVSEMLSSTYSQYSFLMQLLSYAKIKKRVASRNKNKILKDDLIDKEDVISNVVSAVKLRYNTLSRMITAKQEYNKELNMNKQI